MHHAVGAGEGALEGDHPDLLIMLAGAFRDLSTHVDAHVVEAFEGATGCVGEHRLGKYAPFEAWFSYIYLPEVLKTQLKLATRPGN
jgi:hypothetical protein